MADQSVILVIGATGNVGRHVVSGLLGRGAAVRAVGSEELSPGVARQRLLAAWGDSGFVDGALGHWATLTVSPEQVTREVEEVTGSPARTFREWAIDHVADFRSPPQGGRVTGCG